MSESACRLETSPGIVRRGADPRTCTEAETNGLLSEAPQNAERSDRVWKGLSSTNSARASGYCQRRKCIMNSTCAPKPEVDPRT